MIRNGSKVLILLLFFAAAGCGDKSTQPQSNGPPTVEVSLPISDTLTNYEFFTGRTQAINSVELRSRVTGYLEKAPFREGEDVKKDEVLFVIQQKPFEEALKQAKASRNQQKAQLTYNEATYKRNQGLFEKGNGVISREELEQSRAARDGSQAAVEAAEAAIQIAQQNFDWTVIKAPLSGRISRRLVDPGNDVITDNTMLASLVQLDPLYAYFDVDERTLLHIGSLLPEGKVPLDQEVAAKQFPVTLGLANEKPEDFSHKGVLKFADNKVEPTTGTLRMWGIFENHQLDLKPGLFIRVRMGIGEPRPALFVAEAALGSDQGRQYLFVVNDQNKIVYTPVIVGQRKNGLIAVSGLEGGERVVVNNLQAVKAQMEVEPKIVPMPKAKGQTTTTPIVGLTGAGGKGQGTSKSSGNP
jgi:RND family efflux transporter MFP subunit